MDDRRFDDLTKLVGRRASRRSIIKAALAGAVASVFGSSIAEAALSPIKTRPRLCIQPGQPCSAPGADPSRDCCYKCNSTTHKCCENIGYLCTKDTDCCTTASGVQPICRDPQAAGTDRRKACFLPGTLSPGAQCTQNGDCASGNCINGVCSACAVGTTVCGATCCTTAQCQVCVGGVCRSKCGPCQRCENGTCVPICDSCQKCVNNQCVPKCSAALCQTCDPNTGLCATCNGDKCRKCVNGQCVAKCTLCQTCDPATGACTPKTCPNLCDACNPANGQCAPKTCGPCQTCNPTTGACQSTCSACQRCQNNVCVDNCPSTACQRCNAGTGLCESACSLCEVCGPTGGCVPKDCSAFGFGCLGKACDPGTGECTVDVPLSGNSCVDLNGCTHSDTCVDGVCVGIPVDCGPCQVCVSVGSDSWVCEPTLCDPCFVCRDDSGTCEPTVCGPCDECNPYTGQCEDACLECEECDSYGAGCVEMDCSEAGDGICIVGACAGGTCVATNAPDIITSCTDPGTGVCCQGACCPEGCFCDQFGDEFACTDPIRPIPCTLDAFCSQPGSACNVPSPIGICSSQQTPCLFDTDCPTDDICVGASAVCGPLQCDPVDQPCPAGSICLNTSCVPLCLHCLTTGCEGCTTCNEETGACEPGCPACEECDPTGLLCVEMDCSAAGDGVCIVGECLAGQCIGLPAPAESPCPDPDTGPGNCCGLECCDLGVCDCTLVGVTVQCILGDLPATCELGCPPGTICNIGSNICQRLACDDTTPCPAGSVCDILVTNGLCQPLCNHCLTAGCDACDTCNKTTGECEAIECPTCTACVDGLCEVTPGAACPAPEGGTDSARCQDDGRCCVPAGGFAGGVSGQFCRSLNCCSGGCNSDTVLCF